MPPGETIFALSTPPGKAGIAVVRLSGPGVRDVLEAMADGVPRPRHAALRAIREAGGAVIDHCLVLYFAGPKSETGEDMAEFHLHGSRAVVAATIEALGAFPGLRHAEPGEFARRSFENGKLDLTALEGLADLIEAETAGQRRQALGQLGGRLAKLYEGWRGRLVGLMGRLEAGIDFVDEDDVPEDVAGGVQEEAAALAAEIGRHLADGRRGERIREGAALVIAGAPNVGKSSLLNALARRDVAITSETPGTTRDAIEVRLDLGGVAVTTVDTAGLRDAGDAIEAEGMRRARARIGEADLVLWLLEAGEACPESPGEEIAAETWIVHNKIDLLDQPADGDRFAVSARTGAGLDTLIDALEVHFRDRFDPGTDPLITRDRHRRELAAAREALTRVRVLDVGRQTDLVAEELRLAAAALGRVVGRVDVEDILDTIFRDFCIGK